MNPSRSRPLLALALLLVLPVLAAVILSPAAFNGLQSLGERTGILSKLTDARFERVAVRIAMLTALIILIPVIRLTGLVPVIKRGLIPTPPRWRDLGWGILIALASMIGLYGSGWALGAYALTSDLPGLGTLTAMLLGFLLGAVFIGLFEEIFFRSFIHGALRTRLQLLTATLLSSAFFSAIHFFRPRFPQEISRASWHSGLDLLPVMFSRFQWSQDWAFMITLFLMGVTLALFYEKRGNLYLIAGLHGGWVLAMRTGSYLFDRTPETLTFLFGSGSLISKAPLAIVVISWFLVAALLTKPRDIPPVTT
ncbi:MAG TPA: CPBP family intramembrane metalloprotease [Kiritimatiellia bacterium]|nr:CPBP family intramembrane metalloprotease [Kiritimatiellia bacterium]